MLAIPFDTFGASSRKREVMGLYNSTPPIEPLNTSRFEVKRNRLLGDENARPANCNLLQSLQRDNEIRELRLTIEQKEREIHEKDQLLQNLQLRLSAVDSKIRQFDTLGKLFMEQNTKLKAKEEEVSNLSTVVQKLIGENRALKNRLYLHDREDMINYLGN